MGKQDQVNLTKSLAAANAFYFTYNSGKACLLPFLTLYFRQLGLSPTHTGIIICSKALVALAFTPLWSKCAHKFNKYKIVIIFSLFMMIASHLALMLIPPVNQKSVLMSCHHNDSQSWNMQTSKQSRLNSTSIPSTVFHSVSDKPATVAPSVGTNNTMSNNVSGIEISSNTQTDMHNDVHRELETETLPEDTNHEPSAYTEVVGLQANKKPWESSQKTTTSAATENILYQWLKEKDPDLFKVLGNKQFDPNLGNIVRRSSDIEDHDNYDITETLFTNQITNDVNKVFLIVLLVCIVGEALASPMEKLLDDTFFGYLDDVDNTEKYGQQKLWSLLGYVVWGATISIIIENSPCFLNFNISNYMIHFYGFAAMMGLAFLIVLFFPMQSTPSKEHGQNKLLKCVKLLCSDSFNIAYVTSMFLAGVINASKFSFLFWFLADMGSSDLPLGLSVSMSAVMQIPMLCLYPWFTKKITQTGVMTISLASMSIQYVYYSFLWTPWAVVPIEILSAFSIASLQLSALSHAESTSPPGLDRLLQHIFWTMYWQIGFSIGSIVSGVIYQTFSPQVLFRSASLLALFWALGFLIIMRYAPRSKRRMSYSRLLQKRDDLEDDIDDSDEDGGDVFSDDWLVNALKKDLD